MIVNTNLNGLQSAEAEEKIDPTKKGFILLNYHLHIISKGDALVRVTLMIL